MRQKFLAVIAFNVYALFLVSAFQANTPHLFESRLVVEETDYADWGWRDHLEANLLILEEINYSAGWGDHYIWRLFAGVIVTVLVGFLAGAVARQDGAKVAALANIPSIVIWAVTIYLFAFAHVELEASTGFIVISIIAIPLTTCAAYFSGGYGEEIQHQEFSDDTVLGIEAYHWVWIIFPLYLYSVGIVFTSAKLVEFLFVSWIDQSVTWSFSLIKHHFGILGNLLTVVVMLIPIAAWIYPLQIVYRVLTGSLFANYNTMARGILIFVILTIGLILAAIVQIGVYLFLSVIFDL